MARFNKEEWKNQKEKPSYFEETQEEESRLLHIELFPEEYDHMLDSHSDAADRRRGINPMSEEYLAEVEERRKALGVASMGGGNDPARKGSHEYCSALVKERAIKRAPERQRETVRRLTRALHFAAEWHVDQRRKGDRGEPYFNHVAEVAYLLSQATNGEDANLVIAGLLHDTLEDTDATYSELGDIFGEDVADLVQEVSDDKSLPKEERKLLQIKTAHQKSSRAKCLKIADKTANLLALIESPPSDWNAERIQEYFRWAETVVGRCRRHNKWLEKQFDEAHAAGVKKFGSKKRGANQ